MIRITNPFDFRRRRPTTQASRASRMVVSSQVKGFKAAAARQEFHERLLGYLEARKPEMAADISARLAAAREVGP